MKKSQLVKIIKEEILKLQEAKHPAGQHTTHERMTYIQDRTFDYIEKKFKDIDKLNNWWDDNQKLVDKMTINKFAKQAKDNWEDDIIDKAIINLGNWILKQLK